MVGQRRSLVLWITTSLVVTVAAFLALRGMHASETRSVQAQLRNEALLVSEWISSSFDVADYVLRDILTHVRPPDLRFPHPDPAARIRLNALVVTKMTTVPNAFTVQLFDSDCVATHGNTHLGFDARHLPFCQALRSDPHRASAVTHSILGSTGELNVIVARRLGEAGTELRGMAALGIALHAFDVWLDRLTLASGRSIAVLDDRGQLLARRPPPAVDLGTVIESTLLEPILVGELTTAEGTFVSPVDERERLFVAHRVGGLPFIVVAGAATRTYLTAWRAVATVGGVSLALFWLLGGVLLRDHWRVLQQRRDLDHLAHTDALTGLANRRALVARAEHEIARCARHSRPLTLIVVDVDGFKRVNDRNGHATGDRLIEALGSAYRDTVRAEDVAARVGGDEFALLLPEVDAAEAHLVAQRVLRATTNAGHRVLGHAARAATASVGAVTVQPSGATRLDHLLERADQALYQAKQAGKDTFVHVDDVAPEAPLQRWRRRNEPASDANPPTSA